MNISYEGIGRLLVTFPDCGAGEGQVCKINSEGMADVCLTNDRFCGVAHLVDQGMASVQMEGFVTVEYSGAAPTLGYNKLAADGFGGVYVNTSGQTYLVVKVDTSRTTVTFKL